MMQMPDSVDLDLSTCFHTVADIVKKPLHLILFRLYVVTKHVKYLLMGKDEYFFQDPVIM